MIEKRTTEIIRANQAESWCGIASFKDAVLEEVHRVFPSMPLMKLYVGKMPLLPIQMDHSLRWGGLSTFDYVTAIGLHYRLINKRTVKKIHRSGKEIRAWTVNEEKYIQRLIQLGIDGITTDYPNLLTHKNH